jgi:hypothetical protein
VDKTVTLNVRQPTDRAVDLTIGGAANLCKMKAKRKMIHRRDDLTVGQSIVQTLQEFAKEGKPQNAAADKLLKLLRHCPYDGRPFLPQSHNHKFCSYDCRNNDYAERKHLKKMRAKGML